MGRLEEAIDAGWDQLVIIRLRRAVVRAREPKGRLSKILGSDQTANEYKSTAKHGQ
jgi:hypothetical protein